MNKKILILGNGFIGKNLYKYFISKYNNTTITNKIDIDIINLVSIEKYLLKNYYDYIIYAIGVKDVNKCEKYPEIAYNVNSYGVKNIIKYLDINYSKFIYLSTDYVFSGDEGDYSEKDICHPKTIYGQSKLLGEQYSLEFNNTIVVRTSGVYGYSCLWLENLIQQLSENKEVVCFSDIYNTPTYAINLAEMIDKIIQTNFIGIINLTGNDKNNRYQLYTSVATIFNKDPKLLKSGYSNGNFPKDISLNNSLFKKIIKIEPDSTTNGLKRLKNEY